MDADHDMNTSPALAESSAEDPAARFPNGQGPALEQPSQPRPDPNCPFQLEGRLWSRARKNLALLYNGGRPAPENLQNWSSITERIIASNSGH